jgi:hypothetical protein
MRILLIIIITSLFYAACGVKDDPKYEGGFKYDVSKKQT